MSVESTPTTAVDVPARAQPIKLPSIRQAGAWTKATDALLEALEREEAEAMAVFEAARERVKAARQAASAMRQVRALVLVGQPSANGHGRIALGPEHPDHPATMRRWSREYDACRICGTTAVKHGAHGRCSSCATYFGRTGEERTPMEETTAS